MTKVVVPSNLSADFVLDNVAKKIKIADGFKNNVTPVVAPVIDITEPTDAEQVQGELQKIINSIKEAGVFL